MQTGVPVGGDDLDIETFSEVLQDVNLPSSHTGALLTFYLLTTSSGGIVPVEGPLPQIRTVPVKPGVERHSPVSIEATPEDDTFYVYILNQDDETLRRLLFVEADTNDWTRYAFDLSDFLGEDIRLLFGTFNDGERDVSAMYIDDVILGTCP